MPRDWSGARALRDKHGVLPNGRANNAWDGVKSRSTGKICDPTYRDIGQAFPFLMKESLSAAHELHAGGATEGPLVADLDLIGQAMANIWNTSLHDNIAGLSTFHDLYHELKGTDHGQEAWVSFCTFFVQTYFCYMFTVNKMANGLPEGWESDTGEYNAMLTCLSGLDEATRKIVILQWQSNGIWPTHLSYSKLLRRQEDFIAVAREGQELRKQQERERTGDVTVEDTKNTRMLSGTCKTTYEGPCNQCGEPWKSEWTMAPRGYKESTPSVESLYEGHVCMSCTNLENKA